MLETPLFLIELQESLNNIKGDMNMPCNNEIEYTEHSTIIQLDTAWGYGEAMGRVPFNTDDFSELSSPYSVTPDGGNVAQISTLFNVVEGIDQAFDWFYKDCYSFGDRIAKSNERITKIKITASVSRPSQLFIDRVGEAYTSVVEGTGTVVLEATALGDGFIQPNGVANAGAVALDINEALTLSDTIALEVTFMANEKEDGRAGVFRYKGLKAPSWLNIRNISFSALPPIENTVTPVNRGMQNYIEATSYGMRTIEISFQVVAKDELSLMDKVNELSKYLFTDGVPTTLEFNARRGLIWEVLLDGDTSIQESLRVGAGTFRLLCIDPHASGELISKAFNLTLDNSIIELENTGDAESYPLITVELSEDSTNFDIVSSVGNISLGTPSPLTAPEEFDPTPLIADYKFISADGWTNFIKLPTKLESSDYVKQGILRTNTGVLGMENNNFGVMTDPKFHGGAVAKTLPKVLQDFRIEFSAALLGEIPLDASNFIHLCLLDSTGEMFTRLQFGAFHRVRQNGSYLSLNNDERVFLLKNGNKFNNFRGKMTLERVNNLYRLSMGSYPKNFFHPSVDGQFVLGDQWLSDVVTTGWVQAPATIWNKGLGGVGFLMTNFQGRPLPPHISGRRLRIWEVLPEPEDTSKQPINFKAGDKVEVDMRKGQVRLNGAVTPATVDPSTDWFSLSKGVNNIAFNNVVGTATFQYHNKYN